MKTRAGGRPRGGAWRTALLAVYAGLAAGRGWAHDAVLVIESLDVLVDKFSDVVETTIPEADAGDMLLQIRGVVQTWCAQGGVDPTRPLGAFASMPERADGLPEATVAVPVTDLEAFVRLLDGLGASIEPVNDQPGFTHRGILPMAGNVPFFLTASRDYAFLTPVPVGGEALRRTQIGDWVPARPDAGDVSLTLKIDELPAEFTGALLARMQQHRDAHSDRLPGEDEAEYHGRIFGMNLAIDCLTRVIRDGEMLTVDWSVDRDADEVVLAARLASRAGTTLAKSLGVFDRTRSRFSALAPDAALSVWMAVPVSQEIRDFLWGETRRAAAAEMPADPEQRATAEALLGIVEAAIQQDVQDVGMAFVGPDPRHGAYTAAFAARIAEGRRFQALLKKEAAGDDAVTLSAARARDGTAIHRIDTPLDANARRMFGDAASWIAITDEALIFTMGSDTSGPRLVSSGLAAAGGRGDSDAPIAASLHLADLAPLAGEDAHQAVDVARDVFRGPNVGKDRMRLAVGGRGGDLRATLTFDTAVLAFLYRLGREAELVAAAP